MKFSEIVEHASALLQRKGRITYRALKLEFDLSDDQLDVLKDELIDGQQVARDESGKVLVWNADTRTASAPHNLSAPPQAPVTYTPSHLAERIQAEREALEARGVTDGERKSITALFADIKGSTDLIADLDPEEARAILDPTLKLMMDAVHRYEGYVAQSLGDGIFALFGAPIAHEDHPQRALYAALKMQEDVQQYSARLREQGHAPLQIRVGINTGEVVLRSIRKDDLHTDCVPVGQSTNLASRMESLATPGSILVSEQTYKLTEGYFEFKPLGQAQVKGFTEPLSIYEVVGVGPLRTKLQLSVKRGLARFVGRQQEMALLQQALEQAKTGHGQIAAVMGEPGVGKSRLFYEFKLSSQRGCLMLETFSVSHGKAYPYLPLIDLLRNYFQLTTQDDERRRREKVTGRALTLDRSLEDTLPYLFFLLGIAEPTSPLHQMDPQIRRKRILEAIKRLLLRESLNQPLIIIFEDLHWLDAETQAFLQLLSENVATAKILLLVNYRPEYQHQWSGKTFFSQLRLDPLGTEQAAEMLSALLGDAVDATSRSRLHQFILAKTEGNPFFMEEIVQELREQGMLTGGTHGRVPRPSDLRLPTTVQGVLTARMDRLPSAEKALLQTLAVIGREFSASLLRKVVTEPEEALQRLLSRLQAGEFVYEQPAFPEVEYIFKHALTQEVAYNSLLLDRRKVLHERTAQAIEDVYRYNLDDHYSELAYHYSRSGNAQKAVDYLQLAGQQAVRRSASEEAITHFSSALEFLRALPENQERHEKELALQIALGVPLFTIKGLAAPEVERVYARAQELCQYVSDPKQIAPALWGAAAFHWGRSEWKTGRELGERLCAIAEQTQDQELLVEAYQSLGISLFWLGDFVRAQHYLENSFARYEKRNHALASLYGGYDPGIGALTDLILILWMLGYPQQAQDKLQVAVTYAAELDDPHSHVILTLWAAFFHQLQREDRQARDLAESALTLANSHGFFNWLLIAHVIRGWAIAIQGDSKAGAQEIEESLTRQDAAGFALVDAYSYGLLCEVHSHAGSPETALFWVHKALDSIHKNEHHMYEAELYRLKGELTLERESRDWKRESGSPLPQVSSLNPTSSSAVAREAEEYFLKAIDIARLQHAKSLELRATMSLARLWQQQGKRAEAHILLSEIYSWFSEGFDTKDLQEAKVLLDTVA